MVTQGDHVMGYTNEVKRGSLSVDYVSMFGATDDKYNKNVDNGGNTMDQLRHLRELLRESYEERDIVVEFLRDQIAELEERNEHLHARIEHEQALFERIYERYKNGK